jgi:hypothetical protein
VEEEEEKLEESLACEKQKVYQIDRGRKKCVFVASGASISTV